MEKMIKPRTSEWYELRRNKIGSSDASIIMGVNPYKSERELFDEKFAQKDQMESNADIDRGVALEPEARQKFNEIMSLNCDEKVRIHPVHEWMMSTLDGYDSQEHIAVEIKCPRQKNHEKAKNGEIPSIYMPQLQHHIEVNDLDEIFYMSYMNPADYKLIVVKRNDEYIQRMMDKEKAFWDRLQNFDPPELDEIIYEDLSNNDEAVMFSELYQNALTDKKTAEEALERAKSRLIALAGDKNCKINSFKMTKVQRIGAVNYKNIPELNGMDLDKYRSAPVTYWRLTGE